MPISGYGGHPSYNAIHVIEVIDEDSFLLPVVFLLKTISKKAFG